jgi:carbonic anhydrase
MCEECHKFALGRRKFLSLSAASIAATALFSARYAFAASATRSVTADEAFAKLKAGNEKYVSASEVCEVDLANQREHVAKVQTPWATIITCSDSRVPPELLFGGLGLGELFVAVTRATWSIQQQWGRLNTAPSILGFPWLLLWVMKDAGLLLPPAKLWRSTPSFQAL